MKRRLFATMVVGAVALASAACSDDDGAPPEIDAGTDAGIDGGSRDAGRDAGPLPACGSGSALALSQCVETARYRADLEAIALEREPESAHWQVVQDLCASRLEALGFEVERYDYGTGIDVIGTRLGATEPERRVFVGAHYDHVAGCEGADDNASGVAGALEVARVLTSTMYPRTLVVACWDEEERGLVGSRAYAMREQAAARGVEAYFNFEMIGYADDAPNTQTLPPGIDVVFPDVAREWEARERRGDFIAAVANPQARASTDALEAAADRIGLPFIRLDVPDFLVGPGAADDLRRSDHASFWDHGYPGVMLTDTANFRYDRYHCAAGPDVTSGLDHEFATRVVQITVAAAASTLGLE